jgi:high-affinity nickel-transport protein
MPEAGMGAEFLGLLAVALALGLRHGLDADHLATIDSLVRAQLERDAQGAGRAGLWFSVGHGLSVLAVALLFAALAPAGRAPAWLSQSGPAVAGSMLLVLGGWNLRQAWRASPPGGLAQAAWARRALARGGGPRRAGLLLGLLFALSADAVGTALLFAVSAPAEARVAGALALGTAFTAGMVLVDGLSGWTGAWWLRRSHGLTPTAPRLTALLLGLGSLATAALVLTQDWRAQLGWAELAPRWTLSAALLLLLPLGYGLARWRASGSTGPADAGAGRPPSSPRPG